MMGAPPPGYGNPQLLQAQNQAKPGGLASAAAPKPAAVPPLGAPRQLEIATTKEVTEVYEIHNLRKGKAAGSDKASWKTPQQSNVRAHADVVIRKFKLNEKSQNWLNDYEELRHDILRTMVDTIIYERNRTEESKVHEWIIVALKGTTGPTRATNPFGKPRIETKQVQVVLRRQPKPNQPAIAAKPAAGAAAGAKLGGPLAQAQQQPGQHPGQHPQGGHGPGHFAGPPPNFPPPQPLPPPMHPNPQMVQQVLGMQGPGPRNNNNRNNGPPGGFAPNNYPRVAKYVEEVEPSSERDDVETIEHLEYKRRGNKDSKPAMRITGALPPMSPRLRRSQTADERRDDRRERDRDDRRERDRDLRDRNDRDRGDRDRDRNDRDRGDRDRDRSDRDRDDRRRDGERSHLRSSHRHSRYSKQHTHDGGYHSEEEIDYDSFGSEASADASSVNSLDMRRRSGGGRLRHSHAGDLHRSARDSEDLLHRRSSHRRHRDSGHRSSLRRTRSAERMFESEAILAYQLRTNRAEASAAAAATAAANANANANAAVAAVAAAAAGSRPHQQPAGYYAPAPRLLEGPTQLPAYYPDADRGYADDYPPVAAHPPTPPLLSTRPLAYRTSSDRPRGFPPLAPLAPTGDYYPRRRNSLYAGEGEVRYDRTYERAHAAVSSAGRPPLPYPAQQQRPPPPTAPPHVPESPSVAGYEYPLSRARHTAASSRGQSLSAAAVAAGLGLVAPPMSRRASTAYGSENLSDFSRSSSYDSRSEEGGAAPAWRDLERRTERLQGKIEEMRDDVEWDGGPSIGARYRRRGRN
jgi:hypothetical protein